MTEAWQRYLDQHQDRFLAEFLDLLRIPSISTIPESAGEVRRAAEWTARRLQAASLEHVRIMETGGHPLVYGDWLHAPGRPTLLFYGHFDVQPVDPLDLWNSPPFEPVVEDGRVYARGASDMKGNLLLPVIACEALLQTGGALPVNVKFVMEGEEEVGSPALAPFIAAHHDLLACDVAVSADGGNGTPEEPVAGIGTRGLGSLQINVRTASTDLHSGNGGMAPNSIHALVRLLDSLRDAEGRILVEGFYDEVRPLTDAERRQIAAFPGSLEEYLSRNGIRETFGEPEYTAKERVASRPTLEVNGIWGGYQGAGTKTVIPAEAHAKLTCRLVPDQSPEQLLEKVSAHIRRHTPSYAEVTVEIPPDGADPYMLPGDHPALAALERVLTAMTGKAPTRRWGGGTVPIMGMLKRELGVETVTMGASQGDERAHAPDEFLRLSNFTRMQRAFCLYLQEMAR